MLLSLSRSLLQHSSHRRKVHSEVVVGKKHVVPGLGAPSGDFIKKGKGHDQVYVESLQPINVFHSTEFLNSVPGVIAAICFAVKDDMLH